ncbi:hypothetical protein [Natrinema halophilum]|uniref:Uncharacterized protein n=1 Tax=Natrinema halophilum TaxID=1699371 RepID=A0A7D5KS02_9EURY|nr:hypothetical protein [Natrinema halophilum]QLG48964.1 hypothetical protein HYG82_08925 [Natrinema halophilum]
MIADTPTDVAPTYDRLEHLERRIGALETENESLGETIDQQADCIDTVEDELETVEAENERLRELPPRRFTEIWGRNVQD